MLSKEPEPLRVLTEAELKEKEEKMLSLRALVHAELKNVGGSHAAIERLLGPEAATKPYIEYLLKEGVVICTKQTMKEDLAKAVDLLKKENVASLAGTTGAIIVDGATFASDKVFAIMYESGCGIKILLKLVTPENWAEVAANGDEPAVSCSPLRPKLCSSESSPHPPLTSIILYLAPTGVQR